MYADGDAYVDVHVGAYADVGVYMDSDVDMRV